MNGRYTTANIRQAVLENAATAHPRSAAEIAQELGVRVESIYECSSRLRREGKLRPSEHQAGRTARTPISEAIPLPQTAGSSKAEIDSDSGRLLQILETEAVLTDVERQRILSRLARSGPDTVKVQAIKTMEEIKRKQGGQGVLIPPPLTEEELVQRLARLMEPVGHRLAREAWTRAFPLAGPPLEP